MQLKGTGIQARDLGKITYFHLFMEVQLEVECLVFHNFVEKKNVENALKKFILKVFSY